MLVCGTQADVPLGRVVIRPMHPSHLFEAAILTTEAFLVDKDPPRFDWTMCVTAEERQNLKYAMVANRTLHCQSFS